MSASAPASGLSRRRVHYGFASVRIESPAQRAENVRHVARVIGKSCLGRLAGPAPTVPRALSGPTANGAGGRPAMKRGATYLIAAGGTGGHVFPGIEVARELRRRGHHPVFVGTRRGLESRVAPESGFPIEFVRTDALKGVSLGKRLRTILRMPGSLVEAASILDRYRPAAVLSLGGYAAGTLALMALMRDVPLIILEPNARPGLSNRLVGPFAAWSLLGLPGGESYFARKRCEVSGIPIREEFFRLPPKEHRPPMTLLITGGSQGSRSLNRALIEALPLWARQRRLGEMRFLHQTGLSEYEKVRSAYQSQGANARVEAFFDDMPAAFGQADLLVCRAGASAVAEAGAAGKASILVPYPFAADQHQLLNARAVEQAGAARVVLDREITGSRLVEEVDRLVRDPDQLRQLERAARRLAMPGAVRKIADRLEAPGRDRRRD